MYGVSRTAAMNASDTEINTVLVQIRNDEIEVDRNSIRLNKNVLPALNITGIRCSRWGYCIEVKGDFSPPIKIECKRYFRGKSKTIRDFNSIQTAIKQLLVPRVALNIAHQVCAGIDFEINPFVKFTQKGLWKKQMDCIPFYGRTVPKPRVEPSYFVTVAPYRDLEIRELEKWIELGPKGVPKKYFLQTDYNDWNALLLFDLTNHLISSEGRI
jgi:hypothetical protein